MRNAQRQMFAAEILMNNGFCPYAPLMNHFHQEAYPGSNHDWLKMDFEWVAACDVLLRLDGESEGADREVAHAKALGKPVFYSILDLCKWNDLR